MRNIKLVILSVLMILTFTLLISCGGKSDDNTGDTGSQSESSADGSTQLSESAKVDPKSSVDNLLGNWEDTSDSSRFVNISKADDDYIWEDNEGKYKASFKDGVLSISVSENETALAYYDAESGNVICEYAGSETNYKKK